MTELPLLAQPYPDNKPWIDLSSYIGPTWTMGGSAWHFRGLLDGNTATIHLRTRQGTQSVLADALPEEFWPPGELVLQAFTPNKEKPVGAILSATGRLTIYNPQGQPLLDGSLSNFVMQVSYARKAV